MFCDTMYSVASVFNYFMMSLGEKAFHPSTSRKPIQCLIGIFQSLSHKKYKQKLLLSFKNNRLKRVAIVTTALSMGVNFPDVCYVVLFGPVRTLLNFPQEAGRARRDGLSSDVILYFYGQQLAHCEDVHEFLKTSGCFRVASYKSFDPNICCNFVQNHVNVAIQVGAQNQSSHFDKQPTPPSTLPINSRTATDAERTILNDALVCRVTGKPF